MSGLMKNKKGLVMGVANQKSIAWGIAEVLSAEGASLALTYQGENFKKRVEPLAESIGSKLIFDVDVLDESSIDKCFNHLSKEWGSLDFVVHALAFSDKSELSGRFINTSRQNFLNSLDISC
ncbi:MAG: SDR family oxidoreductase, partial [Pseudomonadota bacterium]|nr:SDR family oxidoreductase [Pseudomonadota bacterium]